MADHLTGKEQISRVAARFPELELVMSGPWLIIWEGPLRSFTREYRVRIFWHRWWPGDLFVDPPGKPHILILDPPLRERTDQPLQHVYRRAHPTRICAWDPKENDWDPSQSIADTVIPYAIQWLCSYELWRVSGDWPAPGRHPEVPCENQLSPDHPARFSGAEFVRIGLMTGTFASSALMGAASAGSCRWLSLRDWSLPTFEADPSPTISTLSPARRPAALSLSDLLAA
jgi:hypothetical protein